MGGGGALAPSTLAPQTFAPSLTLPRCAGEGRVGQAAAPYDTTIRGAARAGPWSPAIFSHTRLAIPRYALACSESG